MSLEYIKHHALLLTNVHGLATLLSAKLYMHNICYCGQAVEEELEDERRSHFGYLGPWRLANMCGKGRFR